MKTLNHGWQKAVIGGHPIERLSQTIRVQPPPPVFFFFTSHPGHTIDATRVAILFLLFLNIYIYTHIVSHDILRVFFAIASSDGCTVLPCEHYSTVGPSCEDAD